MSGGRGSPIERMDNRQRLALIDFLEYLQGIDPSKLDDETRSRLERLIDEVSAARHSYGPRFLSDETRADWNVRAGEIDRLYRAASSACDGAPPAAARFFGMCHNLRDMAHMV